MIKDLKQAIIAYMFENDKEFQLVNKTTEKFRQYIYTPEGNYCFGGEEVRNFINAVDDLIQL